MDWIPISEATLIKDEMINFIELNKGCFPHPPTQTIHKGWVDNNDEFYSECADEYIKKSKITYIFKIPNAPSLE